MKVCPELACLAVLSVYSVVPCSEEKPIDRHRWTG